MLVTNVRQQRTIGRAAAAAGGYFELARRLSAAQADRGREEAQPADQAPAASEGNIRQR